MKKRLIASTCIFFITLIGFYVNQTGLRQAKQVSVSADYGSDTDGVVAADGTFIQWWLAADWDDDRWLKEYQVLKEAGMKYVVLTPTAISKYDKDSETIKLMTIYPSKINGAEMMGSGSAGKIDIVDLCLKNAQKVGIKVFLGLNFSDEWWARRLDTEWVFDRVEEGNLIADELWKLYHEKYPDAFYGWYWCWEVDNGTFRSFDLINSKKLLADAIRLQLDYLEKTGKRLPFMLAPYIDWKLSTPNGYANMWKYVLARSGMKAGDILAPQDSIGAKGLLLENYKTWFAHLRRAVDSCPGVELWANTETFNIKDWTGATMDRFVRQLKDLNAYVDNIITFAYSHYYSPNIVDPGFHKTYMEYLKTNNLESEPPTIPESFKAEALPGGRVSLRWSASSDNTGVCGYYIFRDGKKVADLQVKRGSAKNLGSSADTAMVDTGLETGKTYKYEIQAYDFAGNTSAKAGPVIVAAK